MTNEELQAIEARAKPVPREAYFVTSVTLIANLYDGVLRDNRALVAEVRRLRGLVSTAERQDGRGQCPWCSSCFAHRAKCPAFTEDGRVR